MALAVRVHRTLELADDKFYIITCGKAGFQNSNNETSLVTLQLLRKFKFLLFKLLVEQNK